MTSANGKPTAGIVSVACAQDNRFEIRNDNNIEHYIYVQSQLDNLALKDNLTGNDADDRQYLNELLLIRGWSKYKWQDMLTTTTADTVNQGSSIAYNGIVTKDNKALKTPADLVLVRESGLQVIHAGTDGLFKLENKDIIATYPQKVWLQIGGKHVDGFTVKLNDPYLSINEKLFSNLADLQDIDPAIVLDTRNDVLKGFEHAIHLREVKIKGSGEGLLHENECGDYVCRYGWLNCPLHPLETDNVAPVVGQSYTIYPSKQLVTYKGCKGLAVGAHANSLDGIYEEKDFYPADYKVLGDEPAFYSTIYWKGGLNIEANGEAEIYFPTSDISGKFRIVVQGITNEDVVYGEANFTVKKKN